MRSDDGTTRFKIPQGAGRIWFTSKFDMAKAHGKNRIHTVVQHSKKVRCPSGYYLAYGGKCNGNFAIVRGFNFKRLGKFEQV